MFEFVKIYNYSNPENFTGIFNEQNGLFELTREDGNKSRAEHYLDFMNENHSAFLGYRTPDWWRAFPKYSFKDLAEVMIVYKNFIIDPKLSHLVHDQTVSLEQDTDIVVTQKFINDQNFDDFNNGCRSHNIAHGYSYYPVGSTFRT